MSRYKVRWVIDIEASSPKEAAEKCLEIHRDPMSTADFFIITDKDTGKSYSVDLSNYIVEGVCLKNYLK